jgi:glutathione S-transferase
MTLLYGMPFSPFTQRVLIAARLKGHELEVAPPLGGAIQSDEFTVIAAMRRIPVLSDGDWSLCESAAIVAYLDETLDGPPLYPDTPKGRARCRQIEGIVDSEVGAGLRHFALNRMFRVYDIPDRLSYGRDQVAQGLAALEHIGIGADGGFAISPEPGAADAALVPVLAFAQMMTDHFEGGPLIVDVPKVEAYWARAQDHPVLARSIAAMAGVVPVIMARRKAAARG